MCDTSTVTRTIFPFPPFFSSFKIFLVRVLISILTYNFAPQIHIFVNSPEHLARFLEGVIAADPGQLSELVYDTLLELYLRDDVSIVSFFCPHVTPVPLST